MHLKRLGALMLLLMLLSGSVLAEPASPAAFNDIPATIRPGKTERLSFTASANGQAELELFNLAGDRLALLRQGVQLRPGDNSLFWDGSDAQGRALAPGDYRISLRSGSAVVEGTVQVGAPSPQLSNLSVSDAQLHPGDKGWMIAATANMPGTLRLSVMDEAMQQKDLLTASVPAGELHIPWDGMQAGQPVAPGMGTLSLTLTDEQGFSSNAYHLMVQVLAPLATATPQPETTAEPAPTEEATTSVEETPAIEETIATPAPSSPPAQVVQYKVPPMETLAPEDIGKNFWTTPVGQWDEAKIWDIMMQPLTVLKGRDQRETYKLRLTPDASTKRENIVGEITYISQGVHIIETLDNGWTLVEAHNSSYGPDNRSRRGYGNTDDLIRGYVETSVLETVTPRDDYGLLIDKLKQEMYVFKDGKLMTTLIVSTGEPTRQQPWNETPAGEFLMVSRVGGFNAGNLVCPMAMRINGGSLIHEVPYILNENTGYKDYSLQERDLGTKASHGCIRVQRKENDDGINMTWVWNNIKVNTKVLVWDDFPGRFYEYPDAAMPLYFNPTGGQYYHSDQNCSSIKDRWLPLKGSLTYAELDFADNQKLTPCPYCNPPIRSAEIDQINRDNGF